MRTGYSTYVLLLLSVCVTVSYVIIVMSVNINNNRKEPKKEMLLCNKNSFCTDLCIGVVVGSLQNVIIINTVFIASVSE